MATENFTTYTESDGGGYITVTSSKLDVDAMPANQDSYVYKDYGAAHFGGGSDFEHLFDTIAHGIGANCPSFCWAVTNYVDDMYGIDIGNKDALGVFWYTAGEDIYLHECNGGITYNDTYNAADETQYYCTVFYDADASSYGDLFLYIYSDSNRQTLLDTLSLTLHTSQKSYRYVFAVNSYNHGVADAASFDVENLDLQEASDSVNPISGGNRSVIFGGGVIQGAR